MSHQNVVYIETDNNYNTFRGPGWYFVDPEDYSRLNIQGPYKTQDECEKEYYLFCEAAYC